MKPLYIVAAAITAFMLNSCATPEKPVARMPLKLKAGVSAAALDHSDQGTRAYKARQLEDAKGQFELAVAAAPDSAEAHYNLGLAFFSLGQGQEAREHFIQAANLAPGDKVIWDSPALRPYGSPEPNIVTQKKEQEFSKRSPAFGGQGPR
jgi:Tfp pilus assembly protein PilF